MPRADRVHSTQSTRAPSQLPSSQSTAAPDRRSTHAVPIADRVAIPHTDAKQGLAAANKCTDREHLSAHNNGSASEPSFSTSEAAGAHLPACDATCPAELLRSLQRLRSEAAAEVERLLAFLDETDVDADLEPSGDEAEPELGSVDGARREGDQSAWSVGLDGEPALGACEWHPQDGGGYWLYDESRSITGCQIRWGLSAADDREHCDTELEEDDSHDGREPDDGDDEDTGDENEPSLGSTNPTLSGTQSPWSVGNDDDREDEHDGRELSGDEHEPSLGSFDRMANQDHAYPDQRTQEPHYVSEQRCRT